MRDLYLSGSCLGIDSSANKTSDRVLLLLVHFSPKLAVLLVMHFCGCHPLTLAVDTFPAPTASEFLWALRCDSSSYLPGLDQTGSMQN